MKKQIQQQKENSGKGTGLKILFILLLVCIIVGSAIIWYFSNKGDSEASEMTINNSESMFPDELPESDEFNYEEYKIEPPDVEEYYATTSEVKEKVEVTESDTVFSEKEAYQEFIKRGFNQYPIMTEYDMDGNYSGEMEIAEDSSEKHPIYTTYYVSENENMWSITSINGEMYAIPVFYNLSRIDELEVILSEAEIINGYDSTSNLFYKNIPNEDVTDVKIVSEINAKTLETLTEKEIEGL